MSSERRAAKAAHIKRLLDGEGTTVSENAKGFNADRYEAFGNVPEYEQLREEARAIKADAIERLPELIEQLRDSVEANGGQLYVADDAADANRYVQEVAADADAETVVKSKSMTTEEIDLNDALAAADIDTYETDLGEFVLQVADESPSHIVGPAMHRSKEEIAELFNERFEPDEPMETAEELTRFAREYLGERFEEADVGITGANFLVAETGTMALVTNEGNARKTAVTPDTHVAVAGVEKILPTFDDLQPFLQLLARSATGQELSVYTSLLTPPTESPTLEFADDGPLSDGDDDREFHLVLLDNGRFEMREDEDLRETLYCVRCGACANTCANFQQVGGHAFGGETYSGGIATGWEAGVHGEDAAAEFNDLCTGCSRCLDGCPVKIDIPWINTVVRDRINRGADDGQFDFLVDGLTPDAERGGLDPAKRLFGNVETLARLGSATAPVSNWLADRAPARAALERVTGIDHRRDLPTFQRTTLIDWAEARDGLAPRDAERTAVLYPDVYTNYVDVERGKAAVRTLEALGVAVTVPAVGESGRAPLSQGMIDTAREHAERAADVLLDHVEDGRDVVVVEPSDLAMFRHDYEKLLAADDAERLAEHSYDALEYVYGLLENGADDGVLSGPADGEESTSELAYHGHCQARTLGVAEYAPAVLERLGYDVVESSVECCGMAGSFGYKQEYYDLSLAVGEDLAEEFTTPETGGRTVVASGTSCLDQLDSLLAREPSHPIELIAPRLLSR